MTALARDSSIYKRQTRPLVREGAPQKQYRNCQTVINIWSWAPDGARHQDLLTDWLTDWQSVAMWLWLYLAVSPSRVRVKSPETAIRSVEGWCEMAASLRGCASGNRWSSAVGRRYQAAQLRPRLRTLFCVSQWFVECSHELFKSSINPITNPKPIYSHSIKPQYLNNCEQQKIDVIQVAIIRPCGHGNGKVPQQTNCVYHFKIWFHDLCNFQI
jgi:hypothetical protein